MVNTLPPIRLFSVANQSRIDSGEVDAMLASIATQCVPDLKLYLLLQSVPDALVAKIQGTYGDWLVIHGVPAIIPLSQSRNILLGAALRDNDIPAHAIVAFPDDDCTYPKGLLSKVEMLFNQHGVDFINGTYNTLSTKVATYRFSDQEGPFTAAIAIRYASSATMFFRGYVILRLWGFDENLGIGTFLNSAEDVDFLLRALKAGFKGYYKPQLIIQHPIKAGNNVRYYPGNLYVLFKYAPHFTSMWVPAFRRLVGGVKLVLTGQISPVIFAKALRMAFASVVTQAKIPHSTESENPHA